MDDIVDLISSGENSLVEGETDNGDSSSEYEENSVSISADEDDEELPLESEDDEELPLETEEVIVDFELKADKTSVVESNLVPAVEIPKVPIKRMLEDDNVPDNNSPKKTRLSDDCVTESTSFYYQRVHKVIMIL